MVIPKAQSPHIDRMAVVLYDGAIDDVLEAVVGLRGRFGAGSQKATGRD